VIKDFRDTATADFYNGVTSKASRRISHSIESVAHRKLDMLNAAHALQDLRVPPGNRLELLKGSLADFHSIRVNDQFGVIFRWKEGNAFDVQITDYH
jgi:proteic killer suppression protein